MPSLTYFHLLLEFVRGVNWPPHFLALVWTGFWGGCQRSSCGASFGNDKISDLDFADDGHLCGDSGYPFGGPRGAESIHPLGP